MFKYCRYLIVVGGLVILPGGALAQTCPSGWTCNSLLSYLASVAFGVVHPAIETVTLDGSNNYTVVAADCGKKKLLPTGTTPKITLPANFNPGAGVGCSINFRVNAAISYNFTVAAGGVLRNSQNFFHSRGTAIGDNIWVSLVTPSATVAEWDAVGDLTTP